MAVFGAAPEEGGLDALFQSSPDLGVHTSAAAETAFLLGLDTAYGDDALPTLRSWLEALNEALPRP